MATLSEKYVAGFLDADGCVSLHFNKNWKAQLNVHFSQITGKDEVLYAIRDRFGGSLKIETIKGKNYSRLDIRGKLARMMLGVVAKHLVIKRHYADVLMERSQFPVGDAKEVKAWMKQQRRIESLPLPNFPSRKWLAGYFDGDGCLTTSHINRSGAAVLCANIACATYDMEGIRIIQKNFGGTINPLKDTCHSWNISLAPSKALHFLEYFGKYSIVKKSEIDFVLGCARMGHFRKGEDIKRALSQLKSHEHRLSESDVAALVETMAVA